MSLDEIPTTHSEQIERGLPIAKQLPAIIFLDGPDGVGKSTIADALCDIDSGFSQYDYDRVFRDMIDLLPVGLLRMHSVINLLSNEIIPGCKPTYQDAVDRLRGEWFYPLFGDKAEGEMAFENTCDSFDFIDTLIYHGFATDNDILPLVKQVPKSRMMLIQVRRPGVEWEPGDYLDPKNTAMPLFGVPTVVIENSGTKEELIAKVLSALGISPEE